MIQLYFKGEGSNSCSEVPDGTMITVQSNTYEARYSALKSMGCSHEAAAFAANSKWETAHIASETSISATERLKETLNSIVQAYHSQNSNIVDDYAKRDLISKTTSEIKQVIRQAPIPDEGDELTDFITYVKSGAKRPKKESKFFKFIIRLIKSKLMDGNLSDEDRDRSEKEDLIFNEDQIIGNQLYQKLWEIVDVKPEHPLIVPLAKIKLMKKRAPIELIGILNVVILSSELIYSPLLGLGICVAGWLANEFADVDKKYPIQIKSLKLPTHLIASMGLNIVIAVLSYLFD